MTFVCFPLSLVLLCVCVSLREQLKQLVKRKVAEVEV